MERQILHVDVNNAFLSWTAVNNLKKGEKIDIRNIPSVIGGDEERRAGIVLAKSPIAKKFGIVTGESLFMARKKCPNLKVCHADFDIYRKCSNNLYKLFLEYTNKVERFSIDECFLDLTEYLMGETLLKKAIEINQRVKKEFGFTVNVGVGNNKLLAKMASDFEKPDKIHTLYRNEIKTKMWPLPITELFMLGKKTAQKLYNMQIKTIGDLANSDKNMIFKKLGKNGLLVWDYANGIDNSEVNSNYEKPKCISNSVTLPMDICNKAELEKVLLKLTEQVTYRLRKRNLLATTVNVQLKTKDFINFSHQKKLGVATSSTKEIYMQAKNVLHEMHENNEDIRLIGVKVDNLVSKDEMQLSIFDNDSKQENIDKVVDNIKNKYGYSSITRATELQ